MRRRGLAVAASVAIVLVAVLVWSVRVGPAPADRAAPVFDLEALRELAGTDGPVQLQARKVVAGSQFEALVQAGAGWGKVEMPVYPLLLTWADGQTLVVDPAADDACSADFLPAGFFDPEAYARLQQHLRGASHIVATHEHFDHLCGLTRSPHLAELAPRARLTSVQLRGEARMTSLTDEHRALFEPIELDGLLRLAPGVVLIEAPGHTPGSLWVYVRGDGQELLLVGDTLWTGDALRGASKPHLVSALGGEDYGTQPGLHRFLIDLVTAHPEVTVLVAHDGDAWEAALRAGVLEAW